jgi:hypothetical protein
MPPRANYSPQSWNTPDLADLAKTIRSLPFNELLKCWDALDDKGTDRPSVRWLCQIDRYYLLVKILNRYDVWHPWLYERCREVEKDPDNHIDLWAREHYKSSLITFAGTIQEILKDPDITVAIFSHTKPIAKAFLAQIKREMEVNALLKGLFPHIFWADPQKDAPMWSLDGGIVVKRAQNPKEATVEAHGLVDGQPTSRHFKLMVFDDVVTLESVSTPEQIQKTTEAWSLADNLGQAGGRRWHIGTRYNFADTYAHIVSTGVITPRIYPATKDGTKDGIPVLFSQEEWDRRVQTQLEATIACQMLQNPLAGSQRWFDPDDLQVYEARPETVMCYLMVDPARSKKKGSANTAMALIGIDNQGKKYLLDGFDHKMDLMERWINLRELWRKWRVAPGVMGVKVGYERYGAIADMDYFEERIRVENVQGLTIEELEWPSDGPGSKDDRVQRLLPDIRGHSLFLPYEPKDSEPDLTPYQQRMRASGYEYRVARPIIQRDHEGQLYNLSERFRMQVGYYPFTGLKDLIDAVSRIYDMDPRAPEYIDSRVLEPEET